MSTSHSVRATRARRIGEARRLAWAFRQEARQAGAEARALLDRTVEESASDWEALFGRFDAIAARVDAYDQDYSLADLEASEQMLRASLASVGGTAIDWARIQLECQFSDLHIEEL